MNRFLITLLTLIIIAVASLSAYLYYLTHQSASAPAQQVSTTTVATNNYPSQADPKSKEAAKEAFQMQLPRVNVDQTKLEKTVVVQNYALQEWGGKNMGGEALLKFDTAKNQWVVVNDGGGVWSVPDLMAFGVPKDVATLLMAGVPH